MNNFMLSQIPETSAVPELVRKRDFWNLKVWMLFGLVVLGLTLAFFEDKQKAVSSLWFLEPFLYLLFIVGLWFRKRFNFPKRFYLSSKLGFLVYIFLSWAAGMVFELSLTTGGTGGFGGFHPDTKLSFAMAQGFYIPFAILGAFLIKRYHFTIKDMYFVGGMASIYEIIVLGGAALLSPLFFLAPLVVVYYFLVYGTLLALPLVVVNEELLWSPATSFDSSKMSMFRKMFYGLVIGIISWVSQGVWTQALELILQVEGLEEATSDF